ncbi:hypothetical protein Z043_105480 [Scleropages formosus]|uniref:BMERB domain-containing protein n=1 Tax=Scleropages formosus TaxID=113540 RepID=A0A0P7VIA0_SCLFO|nr:hypothetical protein Z043_105480 [Scleropages formosus]
MYIAPPACTLLSVCPEEDIVSMTNSSITAGDTEGELIRIERIQDVLVRRESELRYMRDDMQLCKEITRLKRELQKLVSIPGTVKFPSCPVLSFPNLAPYADKSDGSQQKEEELLWQLHRLVETRDFLVEDVEFEKLRLAPHVSVTKGQGPEGTQLASTPFTPKTGINLLKECCGFNCSLM